MTTVDATAGFNYDPESGLGSVRITDINYGDELSMKQLGMWEFVQEHAPELISELVGQAEDYLTEFLTQRPQYTTLTYYGEKHLWIEADSDQLDRVLTLWRNRNQDEQLGLWSEPS